MAREPLHNRDWGFDTNCFVCEPTNELGLRLPFYADEEAGEVTADFTLADPFSGAPTFVHGGVSLAICDEAQAWATIALAHRLAVTAETTSRFSAPVFVDRSHRVTATIGEVTPETIATQARITDEAGTVCVETEATFVVMSADHLERAVGDRAGDVDGSYLRDA